MPETMFQMVTDTVTVPADSNGLPNTYTLTAPTGKKPLSAGHRDYVTSGHGDVRVTASYPSDDTWVFEIVGTSFAHTVDLFLITATVFEEVPEWPTQ
jgi:hypothetical protein